MSDMSSRQSNLASTLHNLDGRSYGNLKQIRGRYAFGPVTVPEGNYWVMGDNRNNSADSRFHMGDEFQGTVPEENVIGKVQAIILPFSRIGTVDSPDISVG